MLAIDRKQSKTQQMPRCSPNVLPCRIRHDGPVNASKRYWSPKNEVDGTQTAYFRGRKMRGRRVVVPEGYRGAILHKTERSIPVRDKAAEMDEEMEEDEEEESDDIRALDEIATFGEFTVWGHEALPDEKENALARGVGEWIKFAEAMHNSDKPQSGAGAAEGQSRIAGL